MRLVSHMDFEISKQSKQMAEQQLQDRCLLKSNQLGQMTVEKSRFYPMSAALMSPQRGRRIFLCLSGWQHSLGHSICTCSSFDLRPCAVASNLHTLAHDVQVLVSLWNPCVSGEGMVPIFRLLLLTQDCDAQCKLVVPMLVRLVLGEFHFDGDDPSAPLVHAEWLGQLSRSCWNLFKLRRNF